jgi:hypothetical protein
MSFRRARMIGGRLDDEPASIATAFLSRSCACRLALRIILAVLLLMSIWPSGGQAQMFECPPGSVNVSGGGGIMCQCPDGSFASIYGCAAQQQQQPLCPVGTQYCGNSNQCCNNGFYCSHYGCTPVGAIECGGHYCNPGQQCSRSGGCQPAGVVDCGPYYCQPSQRCASGHRACLSQTDIDCGSYSCSSGNKCSSGGCIAQNATDCGNKTFCSNGLKCSRDGKSCLAQDAVDCGSHSCAAGMKCGSSNQCLAHDAVDCGGGKSCPTGNLCLRGGAECVTPAELAERVAAEKQRKIDEAARKKQEADDLKAAQRQQEEKRQQEIAQQKEAAERERREQAARRAEEAEMRRVAAEAEAKRKKDEAEAKRQADAETKRQTEEAKRLAAEAEAKRKAEEAARAKEEKQRLEAEKKQKEEDARRAAEREKEQRAAAAEAEAKRKADAALDRKLQGIMDDPKQTPAMRQIAAIALGKDPSQIGSGSVSSGSAPPKPHDPTAAERELAKLALGKGRVSVTIPQISSDEQLLTVMNNEKEAPAARQLAAIALGKNPASLDLPKPSGQSTSPTTPLVQTVIQPPAQTSSYTFATTPSGTVQVFENGKLISTETPQLASQKYGYQAQGTAAASASPTAAPPIVSGNVTTPSGAVVNAATGQLVSPPPKQGSTSGPAQAVSTASPSTTKPTYTFSPTGSGTIQVSQNGKRISTVTPELAAQQYGYLIPKSTPPLGTTTSPSVSGAPVQTPGTSSPSTPVVTAAGPSMSIVAASKASTPIGLVTQSSQQNSLWGKVATSTTITQVPSNGKSTFVNAIQPAQGITSISQSNIGVGPVVAAIFKKTETTTFLLNQFYQTPLAQTAVDTAAAAGGAIAPKSLQNIGDINTYGNYLVLYKQGNFLGLAQAAVNQGTIAAAQGAGALIGAEAGAASGAGPVLGAKVGSAVGAGTAQFALDVGTFYVAPAAGNVIYNADPALFTPGSK